MSRIQGYENAVASLRSAVLNSSDGATRDGLMKALILVEHAIPDLTDTLSIVTDALDNASSMIDKDQDEEYAYQAELEKGRAALSRIEAASYNPTTPANVILRTFARVMEVGEGEAREVYAKLLGEGRDAIIAEVVVYGLTEGFSRAVGNPAGNYMRFHEHLHRNVGAPLPEGLDADSLYVAAAEIADGNEMDGFSLDQMEKFAIKKGRELQMTMAHATDARPGI